VETYELDRATRRGFLRRLASRDVPDETCAWHLYESALAAIGRDALPPEVLAAVGSLNCPGRSRAVLVKGVLDADTSDGVAERALISATTATGLHVFTYREQSDGRVVHRVEPAPGRDSERGNGGRVRLGFHSDDAAVPSTFRATVLDLLTLDNPGATATYYVETSEIVRHLSTEHLRILRSSRFRLPNPDSFAVFEGQLIYSEPRPVLRMVDDGEVEISCALYSVKAARGDKVARGALRALRSAVRDSEVQRVVLKRGELLAFSNRFGLHARDPITDGRRLRRVYAREDLTCLRSATGVGPSSCVFSVAPLLLIGDPIDPRR
jgi:hypothetical protein